MMLIPALQLTASLHLKISYIYIVLKTILSFLGFRPMSAGTFCCQELDLHRIRARRLKDGQEGWVWKSQWKTVQLGFGCFQKKGYSKMDDL